MTQQPERDTSPHIGPFNPNPVQKAFIESRAKADLFSSRMGEGKSTALAWSAFLHTRHNPGAKWALIRDTWENMQATTMRTFFDWFPPGVFGSFNQTKRMFTWANGVAQGEVVFLGMDDPADASKLMSRELAGFGIDEPAPAITSGGVDEMIFDIGLSRLRQPDMKYYGVKLAENNPDESHWTYRRFVEPGTDGFKLWQPNVPENVANLPEDYYGELRRVWRHRPDLVRRFIEGQFGFQAIGRAVTPEWSDQIQLANGLTPVPKRELALLWDFGHNPTCIVTQMTPLGYWLILDSLVGVDAGVEELIADGVKPLLAERYQGYTWRHIGDPAGMTGEQTSIHRSAVRCLMKELGGRWRSGPVRPSERIDPLRAALARVVGGRGMIQVDRQRAREVWGALRGGWHYNIARSGVIGTQPVKDMHSHPGDAIGYGAALLFPMGKLMKPKGQFRKVQRAGYWGSGPENTQSNMGFEKPGLIVPSHGDLM